MSYDPLFVSCFQILMSVHSKPTNATRNPSVKTGMGHMSAVVTQDIMAAVSTVQVSRSQFR